ncbi:MAG: beta-lactamase family protein [Pirellulales bacterium]|nr:beta-lactamase family protein [Pirellulales bacterium]
MRPILSCLFMVITSNLLYAAEDLPVTGQKVEELRSFDRRFKELLRRHDLPGAAAAVAKDGRLVYARGFGWADRKNRTPLQPDALMRIASISKLITAATVVRLAEQGRLNLDDPVLPYLKKFGAEDNPHLDPRWKQITIEHLLRHIAGFNRYQSFDPMYMPKRFTKELGSPVKPSAIVRFMLGRPLDSDPGTRYAYCNFGYCVLGRVIEEVTGKGYEEAVRELILRPAGIARMRLGKTRPADRAEGEVHYHMSEGAAAVRSVFPEDKKPVPAPYGEFYLEAMDANGGWIASVVDLMRFATALDGRRPPRLLSPESIQKTEALSDPPVYRNRKTGEFYGLGWVIYPQPGDGNNWAHGGSFSGTRAMLIRSYDGLAMTIVLNSQPVKDKSFLLELDQTLWKAAGAVTAWPEGDLFPQYP